MADILHTDPESAISPRLLHSTLSPSVCVIVLADCVSFSVSLHQNLQLS